MHEISVFWLRCAAACYAIGLLHALVTVVRRRVEMFRPAQAAFRVGVILHFVSVVDLTRAVGHLPLNNFYETMSLCALLIAFVYLFVSWRYNFNGLGVFIFPLVFAMTLVGSTELPVAGWTDPRVRDAWLFGHVLCILAGYAALLITAGASIFYLLQERQLKRKRPIAFFDRLPPLATLDNLINRSMGVGFVAITLGVILGGVWAFIESGTKWLGEAKITIAFATWGFYLVTVFLRANWGWRGRKVALMSIMLLGCSALTWAAHIGLRSLLKP